VFACLASNSLGAEIRRERREATFGALVGGLASPFINFKRGVLNLLGGSKAQKKPANQAPKPSYGAPPQTYNAPAPSYSAPVSSYNPPAPSYSAPAPSYDAPAAPAYEPPAPKPDIQILPAPDLSQLAPAAPAVDTYGSPAAAPAVDTYGSPAAAPAVDTYGSPEAAPVVDTYGSPAAAPAVDTYGSPAAAPSVYTYDAPAAAPAYEAPAAAPAVDSYGSPVLPNYVVEQEEPEAPAQPPVYEPATYEPAPVDAPLKIAPAEPAPTEPAPAEPVPTEPAPAEPAPAEPEITVDLTPGVADVVDVKSVVSNVDLRITDVDDQEAREPKAFSGDQPASNELQTVEEKPIVIDLTNSFADIAITTETAKETEPIEAKEAVVETEKPVATQIITFEAVEDIPAISGPVLISDEVISFSPKKESELRNIEFTAVQNEPQTDTFTAAAAVVTEAVAETVTPIVPNEELRSVVVELDSVPVEVAEIEEVDANDVEIIDLRTNKKSSGLTILDHDEDHPEVFVVVDETTTTAIPVTTQADETVDIQEVIVEDEIIKESDTDFSLVNVVETTQAPVKIASTQEPELRRVTFEILSDEEAENVNPEVTFRIVDPAEAQQDTFDTFEVVDTTTVPVVLVNTNIGEIPAAIGSDPVFQEIVNSPENSENVKRGNFAYDPRQHQVYAHNYNDKYSNWYYYRKGY